MSSFTCCCAASSGWINQYAPWPEGLLHLPAQRQYVKSMEQIP